MDALRSAQQPLRRSGDRLRPVMLAVLCLLLTMPAISSAVEVDKEGAADKDSTVKCSVRMILDQEKPSGGIDKRLAFLKRQFSQPPFSAYKTISLLEVKELVIQQGQKQQLTLPNGKIFRLTYKERLLARKDRVRLRMHLSITPPKEKRFLPGTLYTIGNKGLFLVGGDKHKDGTLVVATTCQVK